MHILAYQRLVVHTLLDFQIGAVYVDRVIHHPFIQAAYRDDLTFTTGEMGCIRLRCKITRIILTTKAYGEFIKRDVLAHLCQ